ncbi:InlB B-repeat-containing protein [Cohnella terricola]|nr:InlB B-repeat-containing protein [Cohnella terricola]
MFKRMRKGFNYVLASAVFLGTVLMTSPQSVYAAPGFAGGDGSAGSPFEIETAEQLSLVKNHLGENFKLIDDIDLTDYLASGGAGYNGGEGWEPIGSGGGGFAGTFDGDGWTIKGLFVNRPNDNYQGLFGFTEIGSTIKNVGLVDATVIGGNGVGSLVGVSKGSIAGSYASGTVEGNTAVGGLAGYNYATISNSYASSDLIGDGDNVGGLVGENTNVITDSYASGTVTGRSDVGGLAGKNNGSIANSHATGDVTSSQYGAGGLVSYNNGGSISNSYATGKVKSNGIGDNVGGLISVNASNGSVTNSYATGNVEGGDHVGGLLGFNSGSVTGSYASGDVQARNEVGGLVGFNAASNHIGDSYATGAVTGTDRVGGLAGINQGTITRSYAAGAATGVNEVGGLVGHNDAIIEHSYATGSVTGTDRVGGLVGSDTNNGIGSSYYDMDTTGMQDENKGEGKSSDKMKTQNEYAGWDFTISWSIAEEKNNGYPYLRRSPLFTIVYDANGGSGTAPVNQLNPPGTKAIMAGLGGLTNPGFTFAGWNTQADGQGVRYPSNTAFAVGTENVTLYAQWVLTPTIPTFTVTYDDNESTDGYVPIDINAYEEGETVTVLRNMGDLSKTDHRFVGWNTQADGQGTKYAPGSTFTMGTEDVTLYAQWELIPAIPTFTVTYDDNESTDGDVPIDINAYEEGETVTVLRNMGDLARTGYKFVGWNTQADGQGTSYAVGDTFEMGTEDVTLYAQWKAIPTYTVTYDGNGHTGGSVPTDSGAYVSGAAVSVLGNTGSLTMTGYTFQGWNSQADGKGTDYAANQTFAIANNTVLFAKWAATSGNSGGGGGGPVPSSTSTNGKLTLPAGKAGQVSLEEEITIIVPPDATDKELTITIEKILNAQKLLTQQQVKISSIFDITKNFPENFKKPATMIISFNSAGLKNNQKAAVFYYDEAKKSWVEIAGGKVDRGRISVEVDHFGKFAVFAVDIKSDTPPKDPSTGASPTNFSDIAGHWAAASIRQAVGSGIVSGYPDGTFKPNQKVTRAEFAVMLIKALKLKGESETLKFGDEADIQAWARQEVAQAVQAGIISGYSDGTFRPDAKITRAEMVAMLAKALKLTIEKTDVTGFTDDKIIPEWARGAAAAMKNLGIIGGTGLNRFQADAEASRAEAVTVLLRMLEKAAN